LHGSGISTVRTFNYLMADGHVVPMYARDTCAPGAFASYPPGKMQTRQTDD
jgi:prepilin-type processing-associated H-X9-DG protein